VKRIYFASKSVILSKVDDQRSGVKGGQIVCLFLEGGMRVKMNLALTFDDGPNKATESILLTLKKYSVAGTFFIWGEKIKGQELLIAKMDQAEHEIGNHSYTHTDFTQLTEKDIQREIDKTDKAILQVTGKQTIWFRPPYGHLLENQRENIDKKITFWTLDSQDWKAETTIDEIYRNVTEHWQNGDVVLLHCNERTAQALPNIIKAMHKEGIEGCTMSALTK